MNAGDLVEWVAGSTRRTVLIVSNDAYNAATGMPLAMRVVRGGPGSPYLVPLVDADPIGGRVVVGSISPIRGSNLRNVKGIVTGQTWERVQAATRILLEL